jgi:hypothetical protein
MLRDKDDDIRPVNYGIGTPVGHASRHPVAVAADGIRQRLDSCGALEEAGEQVALRKRGLLIRRARQVRVVLPPRGSEQGLQGVTQVWGKDGESFRGGGAGESGSNRRGVEAFYNRARARGAVRVAGEKG